MDKFSAPILYISSDEESGFGNSRKCDFDHDGIGFGDLEDHDWLSELLYEVDRKKDDDADSDEVVVVSEVISKPKRSRQCSVPASEIVIYSEGNEEDDDCMILECDPAQPRVTEYGKTDNSDCGWSDDSSDLEIVGEKGEVACRDFPHARHLCATFPFNSTPHEVHCSQCHCYVCDSIAPCAHWGTGISISDHCHASDKEKHWKSEREVLKKGDHTMAALPADSFSTGLSPEIRVNSPLPPMPNSLLNYPCFRPVTRPSIPTHVRTPAVLNQGRHRLAGRAVPRYRHQPQFIPQKQPHTLHDINVAAIEKNRHPLVQSPHQYTNQHTFKRSGNIEAFTSSRQSYAKKHCGSRFSEDSSLGRCSASQTPALNQIHRFSNQQYTGQHAANNSTVFQPKTPVLHGMNYRPMNCRPIRPHLDLQPYSSFHKNSMCRPQMSSRSNVSSRFVNATSLQSVIASQLNTRNYQEPLSGDVFQKQMHSTPVAPSSPSHLQPCSKPTSGLVDNQSDFQPSSQIQTPVGTSSASFGASWDDSLHQANALVSAEISQEQSAVLEDDFQHGSITENYHGQDTVQGVGSSLSAVIRPVDNPPLVEEPGCHFHPITASELSVLSFDWMFEKSFPEGLEVSPMSPGIINIFPPEHASIDADCLFDL